MARQDCINEERAYEQKKNENELDSNNPFLYEKEIMNYVQCLKNIKLPPLCLAPYNDCKECLYQSDYNLLACQKPLIQLEECYSDPQGYKEFFERGTQYQKQQKGYDFSNGNLGYFQKKM